MAIYEINLTLDIFNIVVLSAILISFFLAKNREGKKSRLYLLLLLNAVLLSAFDMLTWIFEGTSHTVFYYVINIAVYLLADSITTIYTHFMKACLNEHGRNLKVFRLIVDIFFFISLACTLLGTVYGFVFRIEDGMYVRGSYYWLAHVFAIMVIVANSIVIVTSSNVPSRTRFSLLSYTLLPLISLFCQIFIYGLSAITYNCMTLGMLLIFLNIHIRRGKELTKKEKAAEQAHISLMLSQIQPHFIFNVLNIISALCLKDPDKARETVEDFAAYLRGNLDSLNENVLVPFERELKHVRHYINLEKKRYPEINVEYNITVTNFKLPTLALQPLCENAIRHGLRPKESIWNLYISTYEDHENYYIKVEDDGIGFDPEEKINDGRSHVGVSNIRLRVENLAGGRLQINSIKGEGTTSIIVLPRSKQPKRG